MYEGEAVEVIDFDDDMWEVTHTNVRVVRELEGDEKCYTEVVSMDPAARGEDVQFLFGTPGKDLRTTVPVRKRVAWSVPTDVPPAMLRHRDTGRLFPVLCTTDMSAEVGGASVRCVVTLSLIYL